MHAHVQAHSSMSNRVLSDAWKSLKRRNVMDEPQASVDPRYTPQQKVVGEAWSVECCSTPLDPERPPHTRAEGGPAMTLHA